MLQSGAKKIIHVVKTRTATWTATWTYRIFFSGPYLVEKTRATRKTTNIDDISITGGIITTTTFYYSLRFKINIQRAKRDIIFSISTHRNKKKHFPSVFEQQLNTFTCHDLNEEQK